MKKNISSVILLATIAFSSFSTNANAEKPTFSGIFYGSVMDYKPNIMILKTRPYYTVATSGIKVPVLNRAGNNSDDLLKLAMKDGKEFCHGTPNYTIDNLTLRATPFGSYNNVITELSGNIICFKN